MERDTASATNIRLFMVQLKLDCPNQCALKRFHRSMCVCVCVCVCVWMCGESSEAVIASQPEVDLSRFKRLKFYFAFFHQKL